VYIHRLAITVRDRAAGQVALVSDLLIRAILSGRIVFFEAKILYTAVSGRSGRYREKAKP